ncbi:UPF0147 family protein [Candidatus Woesearchaeota archaeon]|nr:UPF0147 family protein [Candidatus Woesearchaeota archaeon]
MKNDKEINEIVEALNLLVDDPGVPKNVKTSVSKIIFILGENVDLSIKVNKALHELDEVSNDTNLQPFTRTQIWNIVSMLEKM